MTSPEVLIERLAFGGEGVGRLPDGRVVFVRGAFPGERARVRVVEERRAFARAEIDALTLPHPARQPADCALAARCGGCQLWEAPPALAWSWTAAAALDAFSRAAAASPPPLELIAAPQDRRYRRRLRLQVSARGEVGFFAPQSHRLVPVEDCLVAHPALIEALSALRPSLAGAPGALLLELDADQRRVAARWEVEGDLAAAARRLQARWPLAPLRGVLVASASGHGRPQALGDPRFDLIVDGMARTLEVGAFTQANDAVNERLVAWVKAALQPLEGARALELFCGAGNFSLSLLREGAALCGVEIAPEAVRAATAAAEAQALSTRARFLVGDLRRGLPAALRGERFDAILLDPPRTGAKELMPALAASGASRLVYVSCDPPTLGRDLRAPLAQGWRLERLAALEMFPQTWHVEMAALLRAPGA
jgi:23S rRNA (uracil1939-C5)-methyltransferase